MENIFEDIIAKISLPGKGNTHVGPGSTESFKKDQPKEDHIKTHCN